MKSANHYVSERDGAIADTLQRLAKEANRERQAAGYPHRNGKICYSNNVRQLAMTALGHGFSPSIVANAAVVTVQSVLKWQKECHSTFRELRIEPEMCHEQANRALTKNDVIARDSERRIEFVFPSGLRVFVGRQDMDASLIALFSASLGG